MTNSQKEKISATVDLVWKIATGVLLAVMLWVGTTLVELSDTVARLDQRICTIEASADRMTNWLEWWNRTMPALDATQTQQINALEDRVQQLKNRVDRYLENK